MSTVLLVRLRASSKDERVEATGDQDQALDNFLNRQAEFARDWVELQGGRWVRYDEIVEVQVAKH